MFTPTPPPTPHRQAPALGGTLMFTHTAPPPFLVNRQQFGVVYRLMFTHTTPPLPHIVSYQLRIDVGSPKTQIVYYHTSEVWPFKVWAALWPGKCGFVAREASGHFNLGPDRRRWIITLTNQPQKLSQCLRRVKRRLGGH